MIVAVEPSADAIGAALLKELRLLAPPQTIFSGCGGPEMEAAGLESLFPIERLSVMGLTDALRALPEAMKRAEQLAEKARSETADAVVFVDAWAFSRLCAEKMRKQAPQTKLFKLVAPQVWASRPQRIASVKRLFDGVLCLLPFEPAWFEKAGVPAAFIGNPNFQAAWRTRGNGPDFRRRHQLGDSTLLAVLPGSRRGEIDNHLRRFGDAVRLLALRLPNLRVVTALAPAVEDHARRRMQDWPGAPIFAEPYEKADAFAAATVALAKSGTVTTELAVNGTPMVVAYRVDPLTAIWAKMVVTAKYATILNIVAGREAIPEHIQEKCRPERLASDLLALITDRELRLEQVELFPPLLAKLGVDAEPAEKLGALKIAEWMGWRAVS
jgi:lipid-A-disaccharide synthase